MGKKDMNWQTIGSRKVFESSHFQINEDILLSPFDDQITYVYIKKPEAVMIAPRLDKRRWVFVRQYRHPIGKTTLEFPAGGIKKSETPIAAAVRELEEETGFNAHELEEVKSLHTSTGTSSELVHYYFARDLYAPPSPLPRDNEEADLKTVYLTLQEARAEIELGNVSCLGTAALVYWLSCKDLGTI